MTELTHSCCGWSLKGTHSPECPKYVDNDAERLAEIRELAVNPERCWDTATALDKLLEAIDVANRAIDSRDAALRDKATLINRLQQQRDEAVNSTWQAREDRDKSEAALREANDRIIEISKSLSQEKTEAERLRGVNDAHWVLRRATARYGETLEADLHEAREERDRLRSALQEVTRYYPTSLDAFPAFRELVRSRPAPPTPAAPRISGTHLCGHGKMARICPICNATPPTEELEQLRELRHWVERYINAEDGELAVIGGLYTKMKEALAQLATPSPVPCPVTHNDSCRDKYCGEGRCYIRDHLGSSVRADNHEVGQPSPESEDAVLAALVEVERLGRHYSNGEGALVLEIRTGRLRTILQIALSAARVEGERAGLELAAQLCEQEGNARNHRADNPLPGDDTLSPFPQSQVQLSKAVTAHFLARDIRSLLPSAAPETKP